MKIVIYILGLTDLKKMDQEGKAFIQSKLEMVQMVPVDMIDLSNAIDGETPKKKTKTEENQGSSDEDLMTKWFSQGILSNSTYLLHSFFLES